MKSPWTRTLAWIAAVVAAVLFALSAPELLQFSPFQHAVPQGAAAPR